MGTEITQENLAQIKSKKIPTVTERKNDDISNNKYNNNKAKNHKFIDIFQNIYKSYYKKKINSKNVKEDKKESFINSNKENIIIEKNEIAKNNDIQKKEIIENEEINKIIIKRYKSIDLSDLNNQPCKNVLINNDNDINNYNINVDFNSEKDNESISSDYADINRDFYEFNQTQKTSKKRKNPRNNELFSKKIRDSYYNKLIIKRQWNPLNKEQVFNNLFFFDWDDTLLCTSHLLPTGALTDMQINKKDKDLVSNLDNLVSKLLLKTLDLGIVCIITNGASGWVELSSVKFYPKTAKVLEKVKIISARGLCEKKLPGDMRQWKTKAFKYALDNLQIKKDVPTNIICFGDSIIELEASYSIKEYFSNAYLKTIKFKESPTNTELEKELQIITTQLDSILINFKNLSIKVTKKKDD